MALDSDDLDTLATKPLRGKSDAGEIEMRSAADIIALDQYSAAKAAAANPLRGIRLTKLIGPGPIGQASDNELV